MAEEKTYVDESGVRRCNKKLKNDVTCGTPVVKKEGKYGSYWSCPNYQEHEGGEKQTTRGKSLDERHSIEAQVALKEAVHYVEIMAGKNKIATPIGVLEVASQFRDWLQGVPISEPPAKQVPTPPSDEPPPWQAPPLNASIEEKPKTPYQIFLAYTESLGWDNDKRKEYLLKRPPNKLWGELTQAEKAEVAEAVQKEEG